MHAINILTIFGCPMMPDPNDYISSQGEREPRDPGREDRLHGLILFSQRLLLRAAASLRAARTRNASCR